MGRNGASTISARRPSQRLPAKSGAMFVTTCPLRISTLGAAP
ncbi:MAG: hypothetical protein H6P95_2900 [Candidatus Aminicenantes bacterium]|nr:hypothetical protein [Candidatus Aminicenantes bacterium]